MKKALPIIVVVVVLLMFGGCAMSGYNGMVNSKINYQKAWADVQTAYQRRADLIPNLVATVKGASDFEKSTYVLVAQARAGSLKNAVNIPADSLTPQRMAQIQQASSEAQTAARAMINVAIERYPDLKATQNFSDLQAQLEGTENRINTYRNAYNEAVTAYDQSISTFPSNIFAKMFGFPYKEMFKADESAQEAPKVKF